jgi:hypothetical protein
MLVSEVIDQIGGQSWKVRDLFGRSYAVDPYQREYMWEREHLQDLIDDLSRRFLAQRKPEHESRDVAGYEPYFLGPVVTHRKKDGTSIVDGQQRMTTLMLLLMWLHRLQSDRDDAVPGLEQLVVSDHFGEQRFAVEDPIDPRRKVLNALLRGQDVAPELLRGTSHKNLVARFHDLDELFPADLRDDDLPLFIYWLLERVLLVEISTQSKRLAQETFETMNNRGLRLSGVDLLKSFILQRADQADEARISQMWRARVTSLTESDGNGHTTFMKSWLRAKYSRSAADDDAIGGAFDRWLRDNHTEMGLHFPGDFSSLVLHNMDYLSRRYLALLDAAKRPRPKLDAVYFNGLNSVTLQFPLILAALTPDDTEATVTAKSAMVAGYLDIVVARRMVNDRDHRYDAMASSVFALARDIRGLDIASLAKRLGDEIATMPEGFDGIATFTLRHGNRARTKYLLSRLTAWLEVNVDPNPTPPSQAEVVQRLKAHEIEHIWANRPDYQPQVPARRFQAVRNRLGGLVLLTRDINAAFGDTRYEVKVEHYLSQNVLAKSLHPQCYQMNPRFLKFVDEHKLPFHAFPTTFDENAIEHRQRLYRQLCELTWDPTQHGLVVPAASHSNGTSKSRNHFRVTVGQLVQHGLVPVGARLVGAHRGADYTAHLTADGHFVVESGETFESPSAAAAAVLDRPSWPGWTFWRVTLPAGTTVTLDAIRKTALQQGVLPNA